MKKQMLEDRQFPKMHLDLQRLLQVDSWTQLVAFYSELLLLLNIELSYLSCNIQAVACAEQVLPRIKEKCGPNSWLTNGDVSTLEELTSRLRRLKENVGFLVNRVAAIQAGLDSWQSEQINKKLYYISFLSIVFLPLSVITGT